MTSDPSLQESCMAALRHMGVEVGALVGKTNELEAEHEMHICKRCGVAYELSIIDKGFGKHRFCPNCGFREMHQ